VTILRSDLQRYLGAYLGRDFELLAELKERPRSRAGDRLSPAERIRIAEELRLQARSRRPDWPSDEERADDLAMHARVAELLRRVPTPRPG
jgi:hypothetical protein